jgi:starch synthase
MRNDSNLRVLFVTSEVYPLIKTGGLGDVSYSLPNALRKLGVDIRLLIPGYSPVVEKLTLIEVHEDIRLYPLREPVRILAGIMPDGITPVYVIDYPKLYEREGSPYQDSKGKDWADNELRFGILSKIAAMFGSHQLTFKPKIIHCNDWQTGLVPAFLTFNPNPRALTIMSVHNMAYQGIFGSQVVGLFGLPPESFSMFGLEYHGQVSFLKAGLYYANWITTVSPTYAKDIQTPKYGCGLQGLLTQRQAQLTGILNGIDTEIWNSETDAHLTYHYHANNLAGKTPNTQALRTRLGLAQPSSKTIPLIGMVTRLTEQKGIDLVIPIIPELIKKGVQFAILGSGDKELEKRLQQLASSHPEHLSVTLGYDEELAHQIEAGANIFLMPSKFEPCGLNQMYSMRYGTIPIVRRTGGLADTVIDATTENIENQVATGLIFDEEDPRELLYCMQRALRLFRDKTTWQMMQLNGMKRDFSWHQSAQQYVSLYQRLLA